MRVVSYSVLFIILVVRVFSSQVDPLQQGSTASAAADSTDPLITEAWQTLLDELSKLAQPLKSAAFDEGSDLSLKDLTLDGVGLKMADDIVRRMSRHYLGTTSSPRTYQLLHTGNANDHNPMLSQNSNVTAVELHSSEPNSSRLNAASEAARLNIVPGKLETEDHLQGPLHGFKSNSEETANSSDALADLNSNAGCDESVNYSGNKDRHSGGEGLQSPGSRGGGGGDGGSDGGSSRRGRSLLQAGAASDSMMYANVFRLVFGNFFDFVEGARRFLATLAAEANSLLINVHWIRDLSYLATAPLDNLINSNWLPLPQSIDQLRTLLQTALNDYCTPESLLPSQLILGQYRGSTFSLAINPASCPIKVDMKTGHRGIDWDNCSPARLQLTITPATYTNAYYTAPVYTGKVCRYSRAFGTDKTYRVGGGSNSYTFRRSARQLDIVPVLNQFFIRGLFSPFVADNLRFGKVTGGPISIANSTSAPSTVNGTNTAFVVRTAAESLQADAYLRDQMIAIQDDVPVRYAPSRKPSSGAKLGGTTRIDNNRSAVTTAPADTATRNEAGAGDVPLRQEAPPLELKPQAPQQVPPSPMLPAPLSVLPVSQAETTNNAYSQAVAPYRSQNTPASALEEVASSQLKAPDDTVLLLPAVGDDGIERVASFQRDIFLPADTAQQSVHRYKAEAEQSTSAALRSSDVAAVPALGAPSHPPQPTTLPGDHSSSNTSISGAGDAATGDAASDGMHTQAHTPAAGAQNLTYTDWLLGVFDQVFGIKAG